MRLEGYTDPAPRRIAGILGETRIGPGAFSDIPFLIGVAVQHAVAMCEHMGVSTTGTLEIRLAESFLYHDKAMRWDYTPEAPERAAGAS